ncbi:MAG: TolC family protein [Gemmatimonadota bacterium]
MRTALALGLVFAAAGVLPAVATGQEPEVEEEAPAFRPVTLEEAIEIAMRRNPLLEQARTSIESAEHTRLAAIGEFLPDLSLSYGYSNASTGRLDPTGQGIVSTSYSAQLTASYNIFDGWRRFSSLESARLGVAEENARYRENQFETIRLVKQAYFNAVAARELVAVEERRVERQEDQLDFVEQRLQLGRATRSDLLRSQVDLNNARLALLNAENDARNTTFLLTEVVGSDTRLGPVETATLETEPFDYSREQLIQIAQETAPVVRTAVAATEAAEAEVSSARSSYLPSLSFSGGWDWSNQEFPPTDRSWSISLRGSYPLFNGFQRETQVYQARARADLAQAQERATRLNLRSGLEAAYSTAQSALAGIDLAEQSVALSEESLRVEQERYRLGLATILDLQTAQIALSQAEVDLISRRFDYQLAIAQIESLLGQGLTPQQPTPQQP